MKCALFECLRFEMYILYEFYLQIIIFALKDTKFFSKIKCYYILMLKAVTNCIFFKQTSFFE